MLPYQLLRTAAESEVKGEPWRVRQHRRPLMSGGSCATGAGELSACAKKGDINSTQPAFSGKFRCRKALFRRVFCLERL